MSLGRCIACRFSQRAVMWCNYPARIPRQLLGDAGGPAKLLSKNVEPRKSVDVALPKPVNEITLAFGCGFVPVQRADR